MTQQTNAPAAKKGTTFLKVTGILMIIGGAFSFIGAIIALVGIAAILALAGADSGVSGGILYASGALLLVGSVVELIAGIVGVVNCKKPEKANTCIVWGVLVAVLTVVSLILNAVGGGSFSFFSLLTGLVVPVLYIIGAFMNKKA